MKYKINNQIYKIDLNSLNVLGTGTEGSVYEYNNAALKIFNPTRIKYGYALSENKFKLMSNISLDRFILPDELVYEKKRNSYKFVGYTMKLLKNKLPINHLFSLNLKEVINEIKLLESDVDVLSDYGIKMFDFMKNFYYNGKLYIIDTSYYIECADIEDVATSNKRAINDFFIYNLLLKPVSNNLNFEKTPFNSSFLLSLFDNNFDISTLDFSLLLKDLSSNSINNLSDIQKKYVKKHIKEFLK